MDLPGDISPRPDLELEESIKHGRETRRKFWKAVRVIILILITIFMVGQTTNLARITESVEPYIIAFIWLGLGVAFADNSPT